MIKTLPSPIAHRIYLSICSIFLLLGFFSTSAIAQQYSFINYSIEDGLAQTQVEDIFQDDHGYIWFPTLGGISRFDGKFFKNYSAEDGLVNNQVNTIMQDGKKQIWVGLHGGISKFEANRFHMYDLDGLLANTSVTDIEEDAKGKLWLATGGKGLGILDPTTLGTRNATSGIQFFSEEDGLVDNWVKTIYCDKDGKVWIGTQHGIGYLQNGKFYQPFEQEIGKTSISKIKPDSKGNIWICTYGRGVFEYDGSTLTGYTKDANGLISDWIRDIAEDRNGNFWITSKNGMSKFNGKVFRNFQEKDGLFHENLRPIMEDKEGNLWIGTDGKGVLKFTGEAFVTYNSKDNLSSDIVMSITEDHQGNMWFSTYGGGVNKGVKSEADPDHFNFLHYSKKEELANSTVWSSMTDSQGNIWFATANGVTQYTADGQVNHYFEKDGIMDKKVTTIFEDRDHNLWFGTSKGASKMIRTGDTIAFINYPSEENGLGKNVRCIYQDHDGGMWFGTISGVYLMQEGKIIHYTESDGLSNNTVYNIYEDKKHNFWIGTKSGLTFFNRDAFRTLRIGDNYSSNFIHFLMEDDNEQLWIGTNNGIYRMDLAGFYQTGATQFKHYTKWDGIKSRECNMNAAFKDKQGNLWFGTSEGVVKHQPGQHIRSKNITPPYIHITDIKLFHGATDWTVYSDSIHRKTGIPMNLKVPYNKNHFTFHFIGISHTNPSMVRYQFKLEGFDDDWYPVTDANFSTYSNLPDGSYTFLVKAANADGIWSEENASFSFTIRPPFWETWWFILLIILFLGAVGFGIYHWRSLVRKRREATRAVIQRSKLLALEQQALNASMNRHFVFNALNSIQYYINKEDKRSANLYLANFAKLIRKNLDDSQSNLIMLSEELERIKLYLTLENMRFTNKFTYNIEVADDIDTEHIKVPSMMLQPFIENSIWHGILPKEEQGIVEVKVRMDEKRESIVFDIADNGIGIETSQRIKKHNGHDSKGMLITKSRIELLRKLTAQNISINGPFELKNEMNEAAGTKVEIQLPINLN